MYFPTLIIHTSECTNKWKFPKYLLLAMRCGGAAAKGCLFVSNTFAETELWRNQSCQVEHVEFLESVTSLDHPDWSSSSSQVGATGRF